MGVRTLGAALLLILAAPVLAGTGAHFTLGIGAEYLSTSQTVEGRRTSEGTLQPVVFLDFDGNVVDPRFLLFNGRVLTSSFWLDQTGAETTTKRELDYGLGIRAFSNRAISFEVSAMRADSSVTGPTVAGLVPGVAQNFRAILDVRPNGWPQFRVTQTMQRFQADDPATLRDMRSDVTELTGNYSRGLLAVDLLLRRENDDYYNGLIKQELGVGNATVELNRGGRSSFLTQLFVNRYTSETADGGGTSPSESLVWQNRYRQLIGERGSADFFYNHQTTRYGDGPSLAYDQPGASLVLPLSRFFQAEANATYLWSDLDGSRQLRQPAASAGFRYGAEFGAWSIALNPLATYVSVSGSGVPSESSWGGQVYGAVRANFPVWGFGLEGEYAGNQLSIGVLDPSLPVGGGSFLAGLAKNRQFVRLSLRLQPATKFMLTGFAQGNRQVRQTVVGDVTVEFRQAQLDLTAGPFRLTGSASRSEVTGGEVPSSTRIGYAQLTFTPAWWLEMDALIQDEERTAAGVTGSLRFAEAGLRFRYAKLTAYARVREQESSGSGVRSYTDRRIWAGIARTFDFNVGQVGR